MIQTRLMATAFLWNGDDLLMMKRSPTRTIAPGLWAGVGGHLDPHELNTPQQACLREIEEETGLQATDVCSLDLRYIVLRQRGQEIRVQYVYFGETSTRIVRQTAEGELFWIPRSQLLELEQPATSRCILQHALEHGILPDILVGVMSDNGGVPQIIWNPLQDWDV